MGFNFFGSLRRTTRRKMVKKPSAVLVKLCKRYGVKVTSGKSRKYKSTRVLKKQCAKRIRALIRKVKSQKRTKKSTRSRRSRFGLKGGRRSTKRRGVKSMPASMPLKRRTMLQRLRGGIRSTASAAYRNKGRIAGGAAALYAASILGRAAKNKYMRPIPGGPGFLGEARNVLGRDAGRVKRAPGAAYRGAMATPGALYNAPGAAYRGVMGGATAVRTGASDLYNARANRKDSEKVRELLAGEMGRRTGGVRKQLAESSKKANLAARLKAAAAMNFGKRRRRYGFGNGGNPPLNASMGYEFCSNGGGVLGANSTGLFPSPCMGSAPAAAMKFGKRRRRRM